MTIGTAIRRGLDTTTTVSALLLTATAVGVLVTDPAWLRLTITATVGFGLLVVAMRFPPHLVVGALVVWLTVLGLLRRLSSGISPKEAWGDPLLLVGPAVWVVLTLRAMHHGGREDRSRLTTSVLMLGGLLAASTFNPLQGGPIVGFSGALLVVVPIGAFFVGRALLGDQALVKLLWLTALLGLAAAAYGLVQTFSGFPSWDRAWIVNEGYTALRVGGTIRAFASFSAASEYATFLGIAVVAWLALGRGVLRLPLLAGALAFLGVALWYESSRGIIVLTLAAVGAMLAARARLRLSRALVLGIVLLATLPATIDRLTPDRPSAAQGSAELARHQVEGLTDPFGERSTLPSHIFLVQGGIRSAFTNPIGHGVGSITLSAGKYGGVAGTAEGDPGRVPFAAGFPGLLAYVAVLCFGIGRAYRLAATRGDPLSLAALGIVVVTFLQWLNGGHYAVAFWAWLALGWVDAPKHASGDATREGRALAARER